MLILENEAKDRWRKLSSGQPMRPNWRSEIEEQLSLESPQRWAERLQSYADELDGLEPEMALAMRVCSVVIERSPVYTAADLRHAAEAVRNQAIEDCHLVAQAFADKGARLEAQGVLTAATHLASIPLPDAPQPAPHSQVPPPFRTAEPEPRQPSPPEVAPQPAQQQPTPEPAPEPECPVENVAEKPANSQPAARAPQAPPPSAANAATYAREEQELQNEIARMRRLLLDGVEISDEDYEDDDFVEDADVPEQFESVSTPSRPDPLAGFFEQHAPATASPSAEPIVDILSRTIRNLRSFRAELRAHVEANRPRPAPVPRIPAHPAPLRSVTPQPAPPPQPRPTSAPIIAAADISEMAPSTVRQRDLLLSRIAENHARRAAEEEADAKERYATLLRAGF